MNKLLIICGPTATGKTKLGLHLAKKFNGEIISADSRQVYKGMDIGTGKDVSNFEFRISDLSWQGNRLGYFHKADVRIWGYDLVSPNQDFSVAQYQQAADKIVQDIISRSKLPIIVGGTGLYIKALTQTLKTISIKPNSKLRAHLSQHSAFILRNKLKHLDFKRYTAMNDSDRQNPRRLIRAIEIALNPSGKTATNSITKSDQLWIGLKTNLSLIDRKIKLRVNQRLNGGMINEVKKLISSNIDWKSNPTTATGYKQIHDLINHKTTKDNAIKLWVAAEKQYARRQLTWFKKQKQIHWFDIASPGFKPQVDSLTKDWYSNNHQQIR